ncbi:betaine reductase [Hafnia alvei]|uniref:Betaine reductase n=2 Tax=Hafnia alvei TaxID=569 RepID=A0A1C6Z7E3_HAFAL|nr:betaine reductase [Hafnia alvei]
MDLENQRRIKALTEKYPPQDLVVILGGAEAEASGLACETVTNGDPTFAGPLAGVQLGLLCYHIVEDEIKQAVSNDVYQQQVGMMEMVLDIDSIVAEVSQYRAQYCKYLNQ